MRMLGDFRPEVVVSIMQGTPFMCLAERTARKLGIPLVLIVHDLNEQFEKVYPWAKEALFRVNRRVYRSAARRLCVSPEMAEFLEHRYGAPGEVMYPNRSEELQPRAAELSLALRGEGGRGQETGVSEQTACGIRQTANARTTDSSLVTRHSSQASAPLTLGYAGSVAYGYGEELVKLIDVLREVGARIRMFSPKPSGILDPLNHATDVVEICGYRPALEAWKEIQATCDAVILPYSLPAGGNELLYRTHFPSKLTEYLALGMPVIVSGPEWATGVRYAQGRKHKPEAGRPEPKIAPREMGRRGDQTGDRGQETEGKEARHEAIGEGQEAKGGEGNFERGHFDILKRAPNGAVPCTTREELVTVLRRLKEDGELREELAKRAVEAGKRDFDPSAIKSKLWEILRHESGTR
jgi:hypothetical protein